MLIQADRKLTTGYTTHKHDAHTRHTHDIHTHDIHTHTHSHAHSYTFSKTRHTHAHHTEVLQNSIISPDAKLLDLDHVTPETPLPLVYSA